MFLRGILVCMGFISLCLKWPGKGINQVFQTLTGQISRYFRPYFSVPGVSHGVELVLICMGRALQSHKQDCGTLPSIHGTEQSWWQCGEGQRSLNSPDRSTPLQS